jgi:hypothetical protein
VFERRWSTWKARGLAHERFVRWRFVVSAIVIAVGFDGEPAAMSGAAKVQTYRHRVN